jgi:hypothetical protein
MPRFAYTRFEATRAHHRRGVVLHRRLAVLFVACAGLVLFLASGGLGPMLESMFPNDDLDRGERSAPGHLTSASTRRCMHTQRVWVGDREVGESTFAIVEDMTSGLMLLLDAAGSEVAEARFPPGVPSGTLEVFEAHSYTGAVDMFRAQLGATSPATAMQIGQLVRDSRVNPVCRIGGSANRDGDTHLSYGASTDNVNVLIKEDYSDAHRLTASFSSFIEFDHSIDGGDVGSSRYRVEHKMACSRETNPVKVPSNMRASKGVMSRAFVTHVSSAQRSRASAPPSVTYSGGSPVVRTELQSAVLMGERASVSLEAQLSGSGGGINISATLAFAGRSTLARTAVVLQSHTTRMLSLRLDGTLSAAVSTGMVRLAPAPTLELEVRAVLVNGGATIEVVLVPTSTLEQAEMCIPSTRIDLGARVAGTAMHKQIRIMVDEASTCVRASVSDGGHVLQTSPICRMCAGGPCAACTSCITNGPSDTTSTQLDEGGGTTELGVVCADGAPGPEHASPWPTRAIRVCRHVQTVFDPQDTSPQQDVQREVVVVEDATGGMYELRTADGQSLAIALRDPITHRLHAQAADQPTRQLAYTIVQMHIAATSPPTESTRWVYDWRTHMRGAKTTSVDRYGDVRSETVFSHLGREAVVVDRFARDATGRVSAFASEITSHVMPIDGAEMPPMLLRATHRMLCISEPSSTMIRADEHQERAHVDVGEVDEQGRFDQDVTESSAVVAHEDDLKSTHFVQEDGAVIITRAIHGDTVLGVPIGLLLRATVTADPPLFRIEAGVTLLGQHITAATIASGNWKQETHWPSENNKHVVHTEGMPFLDTGLIRLSFKPSLELSVTPTIAMLNGSLQIELDAIISIYSELMVNTDGVPRDTRIGVEVKGAVLDQALSLSISTPNVASAPFSTPICVSLQRRERPRTITAGVACEICDGTPPNCRRCMRGLVDRTTWVSTVNRDKLGANEISNRCEDVVDVVSACAARDGVRLATLSPSMLPQYECQAMHESPCSGMTDKCGDDTCPSQQSTGSICNEKLDLVMAFDASISTILQYNHIKALISSILENVALAPDHVRVGVIQVNCQVVSSITLLDSRAHALQFLSELAIQSGPSLACQPTREELIAVARQLHTDDPRSGARTGVIIIHPIIVSKFYTSHHDVATVTSNDEGWNIEAGLAALYSLCGQTRCVSPSGICNVKCDCCTKKITSPTPSPLPPSPPPLPPPLPPPPSPPPLPPPLPPPPSPPPFPPPPMPPPSPPPLPPPPMPLPPSPPPSMPPPPMPPPPMPPPPMPPPPMPPPPMPPPSPPPGKTVCTDQVLIIVDASLSFPYNSIGSLLRPSVFLEVKDAAKDAVKALSHAGGADVEFSVWKSGSGADDYVMVSAFAGEAASEEAIDGILPKTEFGNSKAPFYEIEKSLSEVSGYSRYDPGFLPNAKRHIIWFTVGGVSDTRPIDDSIKALHDTHGVRTSIFAGTLMAGAISPRGNSNQCFDTFGVVCPTVMDYVKAFYSDVPHVKMYSYGDTSDTCNQHDMCCGQDVFPDDYTPE